MSSRSTTLRRMLDEPEIVVLPGAYDALSARLAERAGFAACSRPASGSRDGAGQPDFGLLTMSETMDRVRHIVRAVTRAGRRGHGHRLRQPAQRRAARCASACTRAWRASSSRTRSGRRSAATSRASASSRPRSTSAKLRAAVDARDDDDLVIIARTDARAPLGLDEAIRRGRCTATLAPTSSSSKRRRASMSCARWRRRSRTRRCSRTWSRAARRRC